MTTKNQDKALPTGGTLERIFGGVTAKILDFLTVHRDWDYSKQDIAKYGGVSMRHALIAIEKLEKIGIITHTRNVGPSHMYQYNTKNQTAMMLQNFSINQAMDECEKIGAEDLTQKPQTNQPKPMIVEA